LSDSIFKFDRTDKPDLKSEEEQAKREGKCLLLFVHGEGLVLTWMAGVYMADFIGEGPGGSEGKSFKTDDVSFDADVPSADGLYIGEFKFVNEGKDWESQTYEYSLGITKLRPATKEEWEHHRNGEWPWEPLKGSCFYDNLGNRDQSLDENGKKPT
jgi:hypothetical protein